MRNFILALLIPVFAFAATPREQTQEILRFAEQSSTPSTPSSGFKKLYLKNDNKVYTLNSLGQEVEVGSGASLGVNYLAANPDAEALVTTGWTTYDDGATAQPVDGVGGTVESTWTASASTPLRGGGSFIFTKDAANRQGEGVCFTMAIPLADRYSMIRVAGDYVVNSGTYADGDLAVYAIGASVIQPAGYRILATSIAAPLSLIEFQGDGSSSVKLCLHVASTSASAYSLKFDSFVVGTNPRAGGVFVSDWTTYTPTGSWTTNTTHTGRWRRVGDSIEVQTLTSLTGAPNSATYTISLPAGLTIDTAKLPGSIADLGLGSLLDNGVTVYALRASFFSTTAVQAALALVSSTYSIVSGNLIETVPFAINTGDAVKLNFRVPIVGWSSNQALSTEADNRVVSSSFGGDSASTTSGNIIVFPTSHFDLTGSYNTGTGRYTTPLPGVYQIDGIYTGSNAGTNLFAYVDGILTSPVGRVQTTNQPTNLAATLRLNAGQLIDIRPDATTDGVATAGYNRITITRVSGPAQIAASESVSARYENTAGTSISNSTTTTIPFATKTWDSHDFCSAGLICTCPVSGKYRVSAHLVWTTNATNQRRMTIVKNNVTNYAFDISGGGNAQSNSASVTVDCLFGDNIRIQGFQNSGGALTLDTAAGENYISIERVAN